MGGCHDANTISYTDGPEARHLETRKRPPPGSQGSEYYSLQQDHTEAVSFVVLFTATQPFVAKATRGEDVGIKGSDLQHSKSHAADVVRVSWLCQINIRHHTPLMS